MSADSQARMERARQKLPLRRVIEQAGLAPANGQWNRFPKCPFCGNDGAGVFTPKAGGSGERFKCFHNPCPSGNEVLDEVGFLAVVRNLDARSAWEVYLREAGEWSEERLPPSVMPGTPRRKANITPDEGETAQLIAEAVAAVRAEGRASVSLLQRRLRLGYNRASRLMEILEKRGIVGPARGAEPREILIQSEEQPPGAVAEKTSEENLPAAEPEAGERPIPSLPAPVSGLETAARVESAAVAGAAGVHDTQAVSTETPANSASPSGVPSLSAPPAFFSGGEKPLADSPRDGKDNPPPSPPAPPAGPLPDSEPPSPAMVALRWFYERLILTAGDEQMLWRKRGLTPETVAATGLRSNQKSNREILLEMEKHFPPMVLLDSGLWKYPSDKSGGEDFGKKPVPNAQYYGMALLPKRDPETGKKMRDEDGKPITEAVWGDPACPICRKEWGCKDHPGPVLIPYFDAAGELIHLRPHKGMMRDRAPRFFVVRPARSYLEEQTPGRRRQLQERSVATAAVPGITMAKMLLPDIEDWLENLTANLAVVTEGEFKALALWQELDEDPTGTLVRQVVVAYDNENKSDPALASYQEEDWKQLEVEVWSRFLAGLLAKQGFAAMVGRLPDAWRDAKGKADWDGRLSFRLKELQVDEPAKWAAAHPTIRAEFMQVLKSAESVRALWQSGLFDSKEKRLIENRLERLNYERLLPIGGEDEDMVVRRLRRLIPRLRRNHSLPQKSIGFLGLVAQKYEETKGGYYIFKKLTEKERDRWEKHLLEASESSDTDLKRVCELVLFAGRERQGGLPQRVTDFYVQAHFCLVKTSGERIRLVSLHNIHGVHTKTIRLLSVEFAQPTKFREWLLNKISGGSWRAGERELQALHEDMGRDLARKEISEVSLRCYHGDSKCWFYGDVVYLPDGSSVTADKDGIIWIKAKGDLTQAYALSDKDQENQDFCHKTPLMHPDVKISDKELQDFFFEAAGNFHDTQGSMAAFLSMGAVLACYAGPEIYAAWNACTSLWVHGQSREGKSCYVRWLMRILGYNIEKGMPLLDSTKAGISVALQQYGEGLIWLEEFQPSAPSWLIEKLKNVHDRGSGIKKMYDEVPRVIRSGVIVTGIATSSNAQLRSRYIHVQVAKKNRKRPLFDWFQKASPRFYLFGRHALMHRKQFAARTLELLGQFVEDETIVGIDERARIVYGAAYAAFMAFDELVGAPFGAPFGEDFRKFTITYAQDNERTVNERMNIAEFWRDVLDANASNAFGETPAERRRLFKVVEYEPKKCPVSEEQMKLGAAIETDRYRWRSLKLYFKPSVLLDMLKKHKRQRGDDKPLEKDDLLNHMRVQPYWVPAPSKSGHSTTFVSGHPRESCWCITVDEHDWGLLKVSDEDFNRSLHPQEGTYAGREDVWVPADEWVDPRKGDLFELIESLEPRKSAANPPTEGAENP